MKVTYLDFEQPIAELEGKIEELDAMHNDTSIDIAKEVNQLNKKLLDLKKDVYGKLTAWQISQLARHPQRPYTLDYIQGLFSD